MSLTRIFTKYIGLFRRNVVLGAKAKIEPAHLARGGPIHIGAYSLVRLGSILMPAGGIIEIGRGVSINQYCILHGENGLKIGDGCLIAPRVSIFASNHAYNKKSKPIRSQGMLDKGGILIGDDCWIGTGAVILDGTRIGKGAVIGAGAVVTKDIPNYSVAVGNPAKVVGNRV